LLAGPCHEKASKNVPQTDVVVRHLRDSDHDSWDRFVSRSAEATFFHRAGWRQVIASSLRHPSYYLLAERDGRIVGVLPLVHVRSRLFGSALISTAFCVQGGPLADDEPARAALVREAIGLAENVRADYVEFRCAHKPDESWQARADLYVSFRSKIEPDPDKAMLAIPRKQRAMIRKGIKLGLTSDIDADVDRFYDVYATSLRNLGTPVLPKAYFRAVKGAFADDCAIVTITEEGRPVSSVLSFYFRDTVLPYYGGGTERARSVAANDFMYWEVMRRAQERQLTWFDFGRSKVNSGSFAFKKNWGFRPEPLVYSYYLRGGSKLPDINPLNPKYRAFIWMWKRLPVSLSKFVGPLIARGIG
jgi:FemAB-related protein (PEP-CTERM system-associated)